MNKLILLICLASCVPPEDNTMERTAAPYQALLQMQQEIIQDQQRSIDEWRGLSERAVEQAERWHGMFVECSSMQEHEHISFLDQEQ